MADLPGVGAGLADHPVTRLLLVPQPGSCDPQTPLAQVVLRYTAPGSGEFNDMQQVMFSHVDVAGIGGQQAVAAVGTPLAIGLPVALERPRARGRLSLASTDPRVQPRIQLNFAADPEDLRRLVEGVRLAWHIAHQPEIARHTHHVALLTEETMGSDDALAAYVRATVSTQFHPCGTARMGPRRRSDGRGRPALPAPRHPEPARGRRVGHADHPPREHQPHLHHDRRARIRLDAWGDVIKASGAPSTSCRLARGGNLCGSPNTLGPTGAW